MVEHLFDSVEVEVVADVLFVDFAEKLVVLEVAEPTDPAHGLLRTVRITLRHLLLLDWSQLSMQIKCTHNHTSAKLFPTSLSLN